jgi:ParB family chromosome partitioning protein
MKIESVDIDAIHLDPANVRAHPERNLATIKASLARFKQQKPIVVDGDGIVRAGNGTLEAARALGWKTIQVVRTPLKGSEATAYAIADNRAADLAQWDETGLAEQLRSLQSEDFDMDAVGYTDDEIGAMLDGLAGGLAGDDLQPPDDAPHTGQYGVIVICGGEGEQKDVYERLAAMGLNCKVVVA